ncbi:hypothetical protein XENOCAPTIV_015662 [Xenoophorus captivus]|uniref:Fibronectin type-III domain-containing protein n=1 Tax=Xenoophorus captivus TaxID=1517983 RepID=A0ABV0QM15_9TELE
MNARTALLDVMKSCLPFGGVGLDAPRRLTVTASTDNSITLVWDVVQGPIDHYRVTFTSSSGITTEVIDATNLSQPVTHLYLSEGTSDSVLVAWSAPAPPADLFILSYSSADGTDTSKVTLDGSKTWSLVQDLLPSTHYMFSLITIQGDVSSEPITASLITGELLSLKYVVCTNGTCSFQPS